MNSRAQVIAQQSPMSAAQARRVWPSDSVAAWAQSGLMLLSGPSSAAPAIPAIDVMAGIDALLEQVRSAAPRPLELDVRLLTERAALIGLTRGGSISCNRSCRFIEARDGWIAVNLARECDLASLPAWLGCSDDDEPWQAVVDAARIRDRAELVEAARLLGLAVTEVPGRREKNPSQTEVPERGEKNPSSSSLPWSTHRIGRGGATERDWRSDPPLVIDLSALWAGPLCGGILSASGARVIKVESIRRPDSIRRSSPGFFDLLNADKQSVAIDFTDAADRARLEAMIVRSDVVIGSARPRAFEQLGLEPEALAAANPSLTWVAITAHGWFGASRNFVGFGDDAAASAGLVIWDQGGRPMFVADAIADPLTGLAAAAGALQGLEQGGGVLVDVSLREAAAFVARGPQLQSCNVTRRQDEWYVRSGSRSIPVLPPKARFTTTRATPFGADTQRVLAESTE